MLTRLRMHRIGVTEQETRGPHRAAGGGVAVTPRPSRLSPDELAFSVSRATLALDKQTGSPQTRSARIQGERYDRARRALASGSSRIVSDSGSRRTVRPTRQAMLPR